MVRKKGNPRFKKVRRRTRRGMRTVYVLKKRARKRTRRRRRRRR